MKPRKPALNPQSHSQRFFNIRTIGTPRQRRRPTSTFLSSPGLVTVGLGNMYRYATAAPGGFRRLEGYALAMPDPKPEDVDFHEETNSPTYDDDRNFYKVEKWTRDGTKAIAYSMPTTVSAEPLGSSVPLSTGRASG
jgi:hypothetical protein